MVFLKIIWRFVPDFVTSLLLTQPYINNNGGQEHHDCDSFIFSSFTTVTQMTDLILRQ